MNTAIPPRSARTVLRSGMSGIAMAAVVWGVLTSASVVAPAQSASAATGSDVTVTAEQQDPNYLTSPAPGLSVTVSQTKDLIDQGITVSWTGGKQSTPPTGDNGGTNFLQIFQCWGDAAANQPDRTTCVYGGVNTPGTFRDGSRVPGSVAPEDAQYTTTSGSYTSIPFRAATGEVVASVVNGVIKPVDVNTNQFFSKYNTNEVPWAGSGADGSGKVKFEVQTALRSSGLGCGTPSTTGSVVKGSSCWLVIVPRGTADSGSDNISASGIFWDAWKHRVAVRLDFRAVGAHCAIGAAERQLSGSELVSNAVQSWQPKLCTAAGGAVYSQLTSAESDAALAAATDPTSALALTSQPLNAGEIGTDPLSYAPIALTGMAIVFAIDRQPRTGSTVPADVIGRRNLPFTDIKLTPRLVAKLLTYSYVDSLPTGADRTHLGWNGPLNPGKNARNLTRDPEFLDLNDDPDWQYQLLISPAISDLLMPQGRSDASVAIWNYVLADADARAFLNGTPDPWGMTVNPWFSTNAAKNPTGGALELPRDNYPKADPVTTPVGQDGALPINLVAWRPYTNDYSASATLTLRGDGQILGGWNPLGNPPAFDKTGRNLPGFQSVLGLTDLGAASQYQLYTAQLRNPAGKFVAPSVASLNAAAAAMVASPQQSAVKVFDPTSTAAKAAAGAYPLAMPVYAAARTTITDTALRASYGAFIRYAVGAGQQPGTAEGQLPDGYAPIPADWTAAALAAADKITAGPTAAPASSSTSSSSSSSSSNTSSGSQNAPSQSSVQTPSDAPQPEATGAAAPLLSSATTPSDPESTPLGSVVLIGLIVGLGTALVSAFVGRRKAIRTWVRH